jgi:starch phosphorylase
MLRKALDAIGSGLFSPDDPQRFRPIVDSLLFGGDPYMVLADFLSYVHTQRSVEAAYHDQAEWTRRSILNVALCGRFSSDRTVLGYAKDVWSVYVPPPQSGRGRMLVSLPPPPVSTDDR